MVLSPRMHQPIRLQHFQMPQDAELSFYQSSLNRQLELILKKSSDFAFLELNSILQQHQNGPIRARDLRVVLAEPAEPAEPAERIS